VIRLNLLKQAPAAAPTSRQPAGSGIRILQRREAVLGMVLLVAGGGMLYYLVSRPPGQTSKTAKAALPPAPAPAPAPEPKPSSPAPAPPPPTPKPEPSPPPKAPSPQGRCEILQVSASTGPTGLTVSVRSAAQVKHKAFELRSPDRIVVDLPGCRALAGSRQYSQLVKHPQIERVRGNQFRPDLYRLVLDARSLPRYQIRSISGGLEIRILGGQP